MHSLPSKPAFLGPPPTTTTLSLLPPPPRPLTTTTSTPGPSSYQPSPLRASLAVTSDPTKCTICAKPPKYTCPRCSLRTCSLPCSVAHKAKYECSGIRPAEGYVSLREYGQGEWAEDYRYLEEGRRRVEGWGQGVKDEELAGGSRGIGEQSGRGGRGGAERGGRGRGGTGDRGPRGRRSKTTALQMELRGKGVWAEFMPDGMGRRRLNQSSWNGKSGMLSLTVQLSVPRNLLAEEPEATKGAKVAESEPLHPTSEERDETIEDNHADHEDSPASPIVVSSTHLKLDTPTSTSPRLYLHPRTLLTDPKKNPLPTLRSLLPPLITPSPDIIYLLPFFPSPARPAPIPTDEAPSSRPSKLFFPPLNPDLPLVDIFKGTAWVEFPTIHIMSEANWKTGLGEGKYGIVELAQPRKRGLEGGEEGVTPKQWGGERDSGWGKRGPKESPAVPAKKAKVAVPTTAALGALGAYASDSDNDEEDEVQVEAGRQGVEIDVLQDEDMEDMDEGDDDAVFDEQPGVGGMLAGLPSDLLVAMSHAINADLA